MKKKIELIKEMPEVNGGFIDMLGDKIGKDFKGAQGVMDWIIYGDETQFYGQREQTDGF
jgi:hypothetical protein